MAPVNRIPSEILALIPDFWNGYYDNKGRDLVALTHVCRAWREVFVSWSSLWTNLDCVGGARTRVYLARSKSLPLNLSLRTEHSLPSSHPFFEIIPRAIGRLKSLSIRAAPQELQYITPHLSRPAPLLENLSIEVGYSYEPHPNLTPALFNGDLSSLRTLKLVYVLTELPWRNMVNLTSFKLRSASSDGTTIKQLLDFFESAPRLRKIGLHFATPTSGAQNGRLVSLACLEGINVTGRDSASTLLDHLLIPVGADLKMDIDLPNPPNRDHPPRFLDNLRNFANFTDTHIRFEERYTQMRFSGPNGRVDMFPELPRFDETDCSVLESLNQFDTSKVERLRIDFCNSPSSDPSYRVLLPMKHLRTLTLDCHRSPHIFVHALHPTMSPSGIVVCPKLEKLVLLLESRETFDMKSIIGVAAARASGGTKLKSVRIVSNWDAFKRTDVLELEQHVLHVECGPKAYGTNDYGDDMDEWD
jgi:hypothetical protein